MAFRGFIKPLLLSFPIILGIISSSSADELKAVGSIKEQDIKSMTSTELEQRGKQLREAIDRAYKNLSKTNALHGNARERDITLIVTQYIPVDISFDDAEKILHNAGFNVSSRPGMNPPKGLPDSYKYNVVASIDPYVSSFAESVGVYVILTPQSSGNYTKVVKLSASFTSAAL